MLLFVVSLFQLFVLGIEVLLISYYPGNVQARSFGFFTTLLYNLQMTFSLFSNFCIFYFFFKIYFIDYASTVVPFPPDHSTPSGTRPPSYIPPLQFMSMGYTYKFFGSYISYTILTLPLSIFYLPFMLLILCTFSSIPLLPFPTDTPPCDLHFCASVPVLVVCLVCFCFCCRCGC